MTAATKLSAQQLTLLRLVQICQGLEPDGWAVITATPPVDLSILPERLVERRLNPDGSGFCRLTHDGETVLEFT